MRALCWRWCLDRDEQEGAMQEKRNLLSHEVRAMRRWRREGQPVKEIAYAIGVHRNVVSGVANGRTYAHRSRHWWGAR